MSETKESHASQTNTGPVSFQVWCCSGAYLHPKMQLMHPHAEHNKPTCQHVYINCMLRVFSTFLYGSDDLGQSGHFTLVYKASGELAVLQASQPFGTCRLVAVLAHAPAVGAEEPDRSNEETPTGQTTTANASNRFRRALCFHR